MVTGRERRQITDVLDIKRHDAIFPEEKKHSATYLALTPLRCLSEETNKMSVAQVTVLISMPKLNHCLAKVKP